MFSFSGDLFIHAIRNSCISFVSCVQYFATLGSEDNIGLDSTPWLSTSVITGRHNKNSFDIADLADIVGSGEAVGGMVNAYVGSAGQEPTQLQRIVARCSCEFHFVNFSPDLDPVAEEHAHEVVVSETWCIFLFYGSMFRIRLWKARGRKLSLSVQPESYL